MRRFRFNKEQQARYIRRVTYYYNQHYFLKDARVKARRDIENEIMIGELTH